MRATHVGGSRLEIGRSPLVVAALMFAVIFILRLVVLNTTGNGLSLLYSIPIVLITVSYGTAAGTAAATVAVLLVVTWMEVQNVNLGAIGVGMRALAFYTVPATIWFARSDLPPVGEAASARSEAEALHADAPPALTRRESEVLGLIAVGHTNAEIADKLVLSVRTVESHRANLQRKLGRPSRPDLVRYAFRQGLIPDRRLPL